MRKLTSINIEQIKIKASSKRKTISGNKPSTIIRARRILKILERDSFKCIKCGSEKELTIDHINGRAFAKWNNHKKYKVSECQVLCIPCHEEKNQNGI